MKRSFRKQNQIAEQRILDDNADIRDKIVRQYYPPKQAPVRRRALLLKVGSVAFACLLIVSVLTVVVTQVFREEDHKYLLQNEVVETIDVNDLYKEYTWLKTVYDWNIMTATRTYDSVSGENLYFEVDLVGSVFAETVDIYLYVNRYYTNRLTISEKSIESTKINGIEIKYNGSASVDSDSLYHFNYFAQYNKDKVDIYLEYQQMWFEDDPHFFTFLQEITD